MGRNASPADNDRESRATRLVIMFVDEGRDAKVEAWVVRKRRRVKRLDQRDA